MSTNASNLSAAQKSALLETLQSRFERHMHRHPHLTWETVRLRLQDAPKKLKSLHELEATGGEPDVVEFHNAGQAVQFVDRARESPVGRRSLCYDTEALASRKENRPVDAAMEMCAGMGANLLSPDQYLQLQEIEEFDLKTSSWLLTPTEVRQLGGALFGDRRYNRAFVYHNGAQSYYAARGFRCIVAI